MTSYGIHVSDWVSLILYRKTNNVYLEHVHNQNATSNVRDIILVLLQQLQKYLLNNKNHTLYISMKLFRWPFHSSLKDWITDISLVRKLTNGSSEYHTKSKQRTSRIDEMSRWCLKLTSDFDNNFLIFFIVEVKYHP